MFLFDICAYPPVQFRCVDGSGEIVYGINKPMCGELNSLWHNITDTMNTTSYPISTARLARSFLGLVRPVTDDGVNVGNLIANSTFSAMPEFTAASPSIDTRQLFSIFMEKYPLATEYYKNFNAYNDNVENNDRIDASEEPSLPVGPFSWVNGIGNFDNFFVRFVDNTHLKWLGSLLLLFIINDMINRLFLHFKFSSFRISSRNS